MARSGSGARRRAEPSVDAPTLQSESGLTAPMGSMELDRLIHERMRLAIVSALAVNPSLSFTELKGLVGATDGNLSVHARKLEDAGYVECTKGYSGRTPLTEYALTRQGRAALERYLSHMEALIAATRAG